MHYDFDTIESLAKEHGYPFYIYDTKHILEQITRLKQAFQGYTLLYSLKCNNHPPVVKYILENGLGIDAASGNEVLQSLGYGCPEEKIFYSAPAKSDKDILNAVQASILIADSYTELQRIDNLCAQEGVFAKVGLRISPSITFSRGHRPSIVQAGPDKFGVSEEELLAHKEFLQNLKHCKLVGFHVYVRSQNLQPTSLGQVFEHIEKLAYMWTENLQLPLEYINFGGGFGIPYAAHMPSLDVSLLQELAANIRARLTARYPHIELCMESGRFLVGQAGTFVTRIVDIKSSRGKTFVMAPGFLSAYLRPAVNGFMNLLLPEEVEGPYEPLWSGPKPVLPTVLGVAVPAQKVHICGNLCTALDTVHRDAQLENIALGNYMLFHNAGAYGAVLSPHFFSSHDQPAVIVL